VDAAAAGGKFGGDPCAQNVDPFAAARGAAGVARGGWRKPYRAKQIIDWLYQKRVTSYDEMTDLPQALRVKLAEEFELVKPEVVRVLGSKDTTQKFLFRLHDGNLIESVLIPASPALYGERSDRRTICVSSQVGCAYGCKFCASGLEGWTRNLEAGEIVQQLMAVEAESGEKIDNVVFMGMGRAARESQEPEAGAQDHQRAVGAGDRCAAHHRLNERPRAADPRAAEDPTQFRLALSLHGATDEVRDKIMPVKSQVPAEGVARGV
jgi:23S rRNA (adenine2503-C2)-methyltransferase